MGFLPKGNATSFAGLGWAGWDRTLGTAVWKYLRLHCELPYVAPPSFPPRSVSSPQDAVGWRSRPRYKAVNEFGVTQPMHFICPSVNQHCTRPMLHLHIDSIASSIHRRISCLARSKHVFFRAPCRQTSGRLSRAKAIPSIMFIYHGRADGRTDADGGATRGATPPQSARRQRVKWQVAARRPASLKSFLLTGQFWRCIFHP